MAEAAGTEGEGGGGPPKRRSKGPLLVGVVLMLACGGAAYFAVSSGLLFGQAEAKKTDSHDPEPLPDIAFLAIDPLIITLGDHRSGRHLRFAAQIEIEKAHEAETRAIVPRFVDVMNTYLRAIDIAVLDDPTALVRLRAQLLRRLQMVAGEGRVRDVLVTEFVIN